MACAWAQPAGHMAQVLRKALRKCLRGSMRCSCSVGYSGASHSLRPARLTLQSSACGKARRCAGLAADAGGAQRAAAAAGAAAARRRGAWRGRRRHAAAAHARHRRARLHGPAGDPRRAVQPRARGGGDSSDQRAGDRAGVCHSRQRACRRPLRRRWRAVDELCGPCQCHGAAAVRLAGLERRSSGCVIHLSSVIYISLAANGKAYALIRAAKAALTTVSFVN